MVLIALKSQFVSLLFSVLTFLAELCLLHFVRALLARHQNSRLQRGHRLRVRSHLAALSRLLTVATLLFISLELVHSFTSDPADLTSPDTQPCVAVDSLLAARDPPEVVPASDVALLRCLQIDDDNRITVHAANYSLSSRALQCEDEPLLLFPARENRRQHIADASRPTATDRFPDPLLFCEQDRCVVVRTIATPQNANGSTTVRLSDQIRNEHLQFLTDDKVPIPLLDTTLNFTADARRLFPQLGSRLLAALSDGINDPIELRRRVFLGSRTGECVFDLRMEATSVPLPFLVAALGAWGVSVLLGALGCWLRARVQYDVSDPMHWATKTVRRDGNDAQDGGEPFVEGVWDNGHCVVYVSTTQVQKQSMLGRLKRYFTTDALDRSTGDVSHPQNSLVKGAAVAGP